MNILLIGDFSAAHYNLKLALESLGHKVLLYSNKDAYKQIPTDKAFYSPKPNENKYLASLKVITSQLRIIPDLWKNWDIIQLIAHSPFHHRINSFLMRYILNRNKPTVLFNAACSYPYNQFVRSLKYSPCQLCKIHDLPHINKSSVCPHEIERQISFEEYVYEKVQAIVSSHYEYYKSFENTPSHKKNHLIPIPFPVKEDEFKPRKPKDKIVVYLGITRIGFKGVPYFLRAIRGLQRSRYGKYFEFIVKEKQPYHKHKEILKNADVLLDQTSSYSYGVNALLGLSLGKIVFSGAEPEALAAIGASPQECPIINVRPNSREIKEKLVNLLEMRDSFPDLQNKGFEFVKKYHDPIKITRQYENLYKTII
ncbi:MAG: glycosyltransferase [Chlorobi bacterium]|nr:glycosyltransferase [Chlorobiota bacterium]